MRLVIKLTLAIAAGITLVLVTHGYLRIDRERELLLSDIRRDHLTLAGTVAEASRTVAAQSGLGPALRLLDYIHGGDNRMLVMWSQRGTAAPADSVEPHALEQLEVVEDGERFLVTRVPLILAPHFRGELEVRESLAPVEEYVDTAIARVATLVAITSGVCALIVGGLGWVLVGASLRRLMDKVRRVGAGDLGGPLRLRQRDEIGRLASEIDRMCEQLADAQERAERETRARVRALEQLRHADRLSTVGKLASGIAHELGTPLNVVTARAKMIARDDTVGSKARDDARIIGEQGERITSIIRQLLDFARRGKAHRESADIGELTRAVLELLEPIARKNRVRLELEGAPAAPIRADSEHLRQAVTNLVMNAIQAQPTGGTVRVSFATLPLAPPHNDGQPAKEQNHVCLRVEDDGPGIDPGALPHVFEPFFTTKEVGEGTGLGLSVAYGIVRDHGGWIEVESPPGRGACFHVYLPTE